MAKRSFAKTRVHVSSGPILSGRAASIAFLCIAVVSLSISALNPSAVNGMRQSTVDLFTPALTLINQPIANAAEFVRSVSGLSQLQATNNALLMENEKLKQWYHTALTLQAENAQLKSLLNFKSEPHHRYISTFVIADPGKNFVKSLIVPAGEYDGVQRGQAVVTQNGLVGRIVEVGANSSRILLISDVNSRVPVLIEDNGTHAILAGTNGDLPTMTHIPPGTKLKAGQRVVTSGYGGVLPRSIPVGVVQIDENGTAFVKPHTERATIMHVKIIDNKADPNLHAGVIQ